MQSASSRVELFGLGFDDLTQVELIERIGESVRHRARCWIATANVNFVCLSARQPEFRALLRSADVLTADGMPLVWASRFVDHPLRERVTGADLLKPLAARAANESWKIFLCGGEPGIAERTAASLCAFAPGLQVVGTAAPAFPTSDSTVDASRNRPLLAEIRRASPDVLFVALGTPKQELWIHHHLSTRELDVPVVVGIGAGFDFLAGRQKRAPQWMCRMGLEWTYRAISQPLRLGPRYARDGVTFVRLLFRALRSAPARSVRRRPRSQSQSQRSTDTTR
jgi:exopolysaccharide biosynthesis WecB/TagA/CpsF family protein